MGRSLFALAALAAGAVAALAEDVVTLTTDSFAKAVKDNDKLVVEFYAPWCGHCKKLAPEWETAAGKLKDDGIVLAKVDATEEKDLASKFDIKGFPTIKIFRGSEDGSSEYEGPRESSGIVSHLKKQFGPAVSELKSKDEADKAAEPEGDISVIGVFDSDSSAGFKAFSEAAEALRNDATFMYTTDASLVNDASGSDTIILYRDFDEPMVKYDGKLEKDDIAKFIEKNSEPKLPELDRSPKNKKAMQRIFGDDKPKVLGVAKADFGDLKAFKENLIAIQEAHDDVHVIFVDPEENKGAMNFFGASEDKLPAVLVHDGANDGKYNSGIIKLNDMKKYVDDFKAGKLEKSIKSEDPPADNSGPVKVATAKTLGDIVDSGKNVLIEFYAPWCGHCKKLEPTFNELGESYSSEDKVVIAKMDATANDVTDKRFDVQGFPTLYWVSEKGDVKKYDSGRDLGSLQAYIEKETGLKAAKAAAEDADTDPVDAAKDAAAGNTGKDEL